MLATNEVDPASLADLMLLLSNDVESNPGPLHFNNNSSSNATTTTKLNNDVRNLVRDAAAEKTVEELQAQVKNLHRIVDHQVGLQRNYLHERN